MDDIMKGNSEASPKGNARSAALSWPWVWAALALLFVATIGEILQSTDPGSSTHRTIMHSWAHPIESNARLRLPFVSASLNSLTFHQDGLHGLAVGSGGGIIATEDGGETWVPQSSSDMPVTLLSVALLNDGQRAWAVGYEGVIVATQDGGKTWARQASGTSQTLRSVTMLNDGQHGWAVGDTGLIIATQDGGRTWVHQTTVGRALQSLVFLGDGRRGWAVGSSGAIFSTQDGGKTWVSQSLAASLQFYSTAFLGDGMRGWVVGDAGVILSTDDGGRTWRPQVSGTTRELNCVTFLSGGQRGWAVGDDGVVVSTKDGGNTWRAQDSRTTQRLKSVTFLSDGKHGWAVGTEGAIVVTQDGGETWAPQSRGAMPSLGALALAGDTYGWAVGDAGEILSTKDGGNTWRRQTSPTSQTLHSVTFPRDERVGWAVGEKGEIVATRDGGITWREQSTGKFGALFSVGFSRDGLHGWAVGDAGVIIATRDGGTTWQRQASPTTKALHSVYFSPEGQYGWAVGEEGEIVVTQDGGTHWRRQVSGTTRWLESVDFLNDRQHGWAVGDSGEILATADGGEHWEEEVSGTTQGLYSVEFLSDGRRGWAVGNRGEVVSTEDGGSHWARRNSGTTQSLLAVSFLGNGQRGWAVGVGEAIIATHDGGQTWHPAERYVRYPAPWYWALVVICGSLVWIAWLRRRSGGPEGIADVAASDGAVSSFDDDRLEFGGLARGISRFLRNPETRPPLTVAITGDWGTGKSSLMQLVRADLQRFGCRPVWFNAWHHQKEEHLFAALLGAVQAQALPPFWTPSGIQFRANLLWLRSKKHFFISLSVFAVVSGLFGYAATQGSPIAAVTTVMKYLAEKENTSRDRTGSHAIVTDAGRTQSATSFEAPSEPFPTIPRASLIASLIALLMATGAVMKGAKAFGINPAVLLAEARQIIGFSIATAQNDFRTIFARQFSEVTEAMPSRLVVIIDDLDRCRPESLHEIMEAVNFLTSAGECIVIFGMATDRVQAALGLAFREIARDLVIVPPDAVNSPSDPQIAEAVEREKRIAYARDYLQKLVNLEIKVPARHDIAPDQLLLLTSKRTRKWFADVWRTLLSPWPAYLAATAITLGAILGQTFGQSQLPAADAAPMVYEKIDNSVPPGETDKSSEFKIGQRETRALIPLGPHFSFQAGTSQSLTSTIGSIVLAFLIFSLTLLAVVLRGVRKGIVEVRDSADFKKALTIWSREVATEHRTPRAIKRFGNRIRYFAMLQQAEGSNDSLGTIVKKNVIAWLPERIARHFIHKPQEIKHPDALEDHQLIAMGAYFEIYGTGWREQINRAMYFSIGPTSSEQSSLFYAAKKHREEFDVPWPPTEAEQNVFEKLLEGIRLGGDPLKLDPRSESTIRWKVGEAPGPDDEN